MVRFTIMLSALSTVVLALAPGQTVDVSSKYPVYLVHYPSVQKDLELSRAALEKLAALEKHQRQIQMNMITEVATSPNGRPQPLTPRARTQAGAEMLKLNAEMLAVLSPAQKARLKEIGLQSVGVDALRSPVIAALLNLNESQRTRLIASGDSHHQAYRKEMISLVGDGHIGAKNMNENAQKLAVARRDMIVQLDADAAKILTAKQEKMWKAMEGRTFPIETIFVPEPALAVNVRPGKRR